MTVLPSRVFLALAERMAAYSGALQMAFRAADAASASGARQGAGVAMPAVPALPGAAQSAAFGAAPSAGIPPAFSFATV